jgi:hypothetical protein
MLGGYEPGRLTLEAHSAWHCTAFWEVPFLKEAFQGMLEGHQGTESLTVPPSVWTLCEVLRGSMCPFVAGPWSLSLFLGVVRCNWGWAVTRRSSSATEHGSHPDQEGSAQHCKYQCCQWELSRVPGLGRPGSSETDFCQQELGSVEENLIPGFCVTASVQVGQSLSPEPSSFISRELGDAHGGTLATWCFLLEFYVSRFPDNI